MIILKLKSGLGNQMFMYAVARRIALDNSDILKFDLSWFGNYKNKDIPRELGIDKFNISLVKASEAEILPLLPGKIKVFWEKLIGKFFLNYHHKFHKNILKTGGSRYLEGYFQSYKYFDSIRDMILEDFQLKDGFSKVGDEIRKLILASGESVGVHIRRGDFAGVNEGYNGLYGVDYYKKAVNIIATKFNSPSFFIFSDDIEWAKNNLKFDFPMEFVSRPGLSDAEEIILMSICRHQIIANSTFSWWSAWLNQNPNKTVIVPARWLKKQDINTEDLLPKEWTKIDTDY